MPTSTQSNATSSSKPNIKPAIALGTGVLTLFLGSFVAWSVTAPLDSAAIAPGVISVEHGRKTVAHLEGGIVGNLNVREGDKVEAGQPLIQLDNENAQATYQLLLDRQSVTLALQARLLAEYNGMTEILFPSALTEGDRANANATIMASQQNVFDTRQDTLDTRKKILTQRVTQLRSEIDGLMGQLNSERKQLSLLNEELRMVKKTYQQKLVDKPHLLQIQRKVHESAGKINLHKSQIAKAKQSIGETELRIIEIDSTRTNEIAEELRTVEAELLDLNNRLQAAQDVHQRATIRAPISGTVVALKVHTPGGVIQPGEPLLDIVPDGESLVIEARVNPNDIDVVQNGMHAQMRLTAFNQRTTPLHEGTVESVSADHLIDENTSENYYLARIRLNEASPLELKPGMKAEVMIVTGERTFMEYMLEPLTNSFNRAFRES